MGEKRFTVAGRFAWHELVTPDVKGAMSFYGGLFNWIFRESYRGEGETYRGFGVPGMALGGFADNVPGGGRPAHWLPYVTVEDADRSAEDARKMGGLVVSPPRSVPGFGRTAVMEDPTGARFAVLSSGDPDEELPQGDPAPGTFVWNDVLSRKPEEAGKFYCAIAGWQLFTMDMGKEGTYYLLRRGEANEGGIILKPAEAEGPSQWLPYVSVRKVEQSCVAAAELGGSVHVPPSDLHGAGLYAVIGDPSGALLALFQPAPSAS